MYSLFVFSFFFLFFVACAKLSWPHSQLFSRH